MKRLFITNVIALLISVAAMAQDKKVAVFDPAGEVSGSIKTILREEISSVIVNTDGYTVLEREMIDRVLRENRFQESGMVDDSQVSEMGKRMGANLVFVTSVTRIGDNYYLSCKLIDVETARIEKQRTAQTQRGTNDILDVTKKVVEEMFGRTLKLVDTDFAVSELTADKRKVFCDGDKLSKSEARSKMQGTDALRLYNKSVSRKRTGNILFVTGMAGIAGGVYTAVAMPLDQRYTYSGPDGRPHFGYYEDKNVIVGGSLAAAGAVVSITGMIIKSSSKKYVRRSVESYNSSVKKKTGMEWNFDCTGNKISLVISF
jgi:hypothetical protein